jgi:hypothetical protein
MDEKSYKPPLSMDERSYLRFFPDDVCTGNERLEAILGEHQVELENLWMVGYGVNIVCYVPSP